MSEPKSNNKTLRDKYIELVEEQAELEKKSVEQIDSLRRTLIRVSLTADGMDSSLDDALAYLREHIKDKNKLSFSGPLNSVENAVLAFDEQKNKRQEQLITAMSELCNQLVRIDPPRTIKSKIKVFSKKLRPRLQKQYAIVDVLDDFALLQQETLDNASAQPISLLEKLFGGTKNKTELTEEVAVENYSLETNDLKNHDDNNQEIKNDGSEVDVKQENSAKENKNTAVRSDLVRAGTDKFSEENLPVDLQHIAARAAEILRALLDDIEPVNCVEEKIVNARERIEKGLNWNDFVPTLEDIRDLIMQTKVESDHEYITYLLQVAEELKTLSQLAKSATFTAQQQDAWQEQAELEIGSQLQTLSKEVSKADDLSELKSLVNSSIKEIRGAIASPPKTDKNLLSTQIQALLKHVKKLEKEAEKTHQNLCEQREKAQKDSLTELPNREAYNERSHLEYSRWRRYKNPLSMAVVDIDHFKHVNDNYGHQVGDKVLKLLARELLKHLREVDFVARYGGEEFVVLLPETSKELSLSALEKVRMGLAAIPFHFKNKPVQITVSIGISEFLNGDTVDSVFARADKALYEAKKLGRNQCIVD